MGSQHDSSYRLMTQEGFSNIVITELACVYIFLILGLSMPYGINSKQYYQVQGI